MTAEELIAFEKDIAACYDAGQIRAPIHLDGGNEEQLIEIFKEYRPGDWVCCSWRSHYKALLAGIPPAKVKAAILAGHSITLCFPEHRFISSAIVGGILPIALGLAWSIKRAGGKEKVFVFIGDMTSMTGMFIECAIYAKSQDLPIHFVIEDNGKSVCSPTQDVWGNENDPMNWTGSKNAVIDGFQYTLLFPHSGAGKRVNF